MPSLLIIVAALFGFILTLLATLYYVFKNSHSRDSSFFKGTFGHRGCRILGIPENTSESFAFALERNVDGVEFDIQLTKDNKIVVFHDSNCNRMLKSISPMFSDSTRIDELTFEELTNRFEYICGKNRKMESFDVILDQIFKIKQNAKLMIEVKSDSGISIIVNQLVEIFKKYTLYDKAVVGSFNPYVLYYIRKQDPKIVTLLLVKEQLLSPFFDESAEFVPKFVTKLPLPIRFLLKNISFGIDWMYFNLCKSVLPSFLGVGVLGFSYDLVESGKVNAESFLASGYQLNTWTVNDPKIKSNFIKRGLSVTTDSLFENN
jgi:glycerophosphoinositol glycerophosphodiesterase